MGLRGTSGGLAAAAVMIAAVAMPAPTLAAPSNDDFANALTYTPDPIVGHYTVFSNLGASSEAGEPNHAGVVGGKSVWFNITYPVSGPTEISTCIHVSSEFDTLLAVYTGNAVNGLTPVVSNDNAGSPAYCGALSTVSLNAVAGTTYRVAVDGAGGAQGHFGLIAPRVLIPNVITVTIDKIEVNSKKQQATVSFTASDSNPEFSGNNVNDCTVDRESISNTANSGCISPIVFNDLKPGTHTAKISRGDQSATQQFTVKKKKKKKKKRKKHRHKRH